MRRRRSPGVRPLLIAAVALAVILAGSGEVARAASVPPPTPVPPTGSPSPFPTSLQTPQNSLRTPTVDAAAGVLVDVTSGEVLYAKNPDAPRPIASITKLMTAVLTLERSHMTDVVTVAPDAVISPFDRRHGIAALGLVAGEHITVENLLYALLLQSANDAALALADHVAGGAPAFVAAMNVRAAKLGMTGTHFFSPNGLDDRGTSTARDLVTLMEAALATPGFERIDTTQFWTIPSPSGPPRHIQNRDVMLWLYPGVAGGKTGYTAKAGQCVVVSAVRGDRTLVAVVLGSSHEPFSAAAALFNYGFDAFTRHTFTTAGQPAGLLLIRGGAVPVATENDLTALVPTALLGDAVSRWVADARAAYPPVQGQRVGTLVVSVPGVTVGRVPLVVTSVPPPPAPPDDRAWWLRAGGTLVDAVSGALSSFTG